MIVQPFDVNVQGPKRFRFVDRMAIDSPVEQQQVQLAITEQLMLAQQDAMCAALGITELEAIPNFGFAVYDDDVRVGVYLLAANQYVSGPWVDVVDWVQTNNDDAIIHGRHMPSFEGLSVEDEQELAMETTWHFLHNNLVTAGGHELKFQKISWAIFTGRTDPKSLRTIGMHNRVVSDPRLKVTMVPDENDASLTRVDAEPK